MLQIALVIEDKLSLDELQEEIQEIEDHVQSTDVAGQSSFFLILTTPSRFRIV
jgi:translation elongation factor EF-1beta